MTVKEEILFDLSKYENIVELAESDEMFWDDLYLHMDDSYYIYDAHGGYWYGIEHRYHYAPIQYLIEENKTVRFDIIEDEDLTKDLDETFYED